jgi:hypothetical protein
MANSKEECNHAQPKKPNTRERYLKSIGMKCVREAPEDLEPADAKVFRIQIVAEDVLRRFYKKGRLRVRDQVNRTEGISHHTH